MRKHIYAPLAWEEVEDLHAGDSVLLSGTIYTGRDAAHKRLCNLIETGEEFLECTCKSDLRRNDGLICPSREVFA